VNRFRLLGLCLMVGLSAGAAIAQTALADAPEFGTCSMLAGEKVGRTTSYHGGYSNHACTRVSPEHTGRYEWHPGVTRRQFSTNTAEGTTVVLETVGKTTVTCTGESSTGEYTSPKLQENVVFRLTGCEAAGFKTSSVGAAEGEVVTNPTECELGVVRKGETPVKDKLGLTCAEEGQFVWMTWGTPGSYAGVVEMCLSGWWFFTMAANRVGRTTSTLVSAQSHGIQKIEKFEEGPPEPLESSLDGLPNERAGLSLTTVQTSEEGVEANSVA
jgi:hypothetical protein